jgi:uncharacterized protein YhaN
LRIYRIEIDGFGCLRDISVELSPGFNLFYGLNEAGKSTFQQAVCALLYGFYDHDRARPDEARKHERFRPWSGNNGSTVYRGSLSYALEDGRTFEVRRDFSGADVPTQVIDLSTGLDVAGSFGRGRHGNVPFARRLLGMSRAVFESCAFISQGEVFRVANGASPREISDAIAALADSSRRDVSAASAIARLEQAISRIGSDRARTAELPKAREQLKGAQAELAQLDAARAALAEKAAHLDRLRAELASLEGEIARTDYLLKRARAGALRERIAHVRQAEQTIERARRKMAETERYASITSQLRDEVLSLSAQRQSAQDSLARCRAELDCTPELSAQERMEFEALRSSVGSLTPDQIGAVEMAAYAPLPPAGLRALMRKVARALALAFLRLVRLLLKRPAPAMPEEATPTVSRAEALALLERYRRFLQLRPLVEERQRIERRLEAAEAAVSGVESRLAALLTGVLDGAPGDDIEGVLELFSEAWRHRQEHHAAAAALEEAERVRRMALGERSIQELAERVRDLESALRALVAARPELQEVDSPQSPDQLSQALERLQAKHRDLEMEALRLEEELRLRLDRHRPRAEIEEERARWQAEVGRLERARAAAKMARDAIEEAMLGVHRDFAPVVNAFLSGGIEFATGGRYRRAHVDPASLQISVLIPETGQVITNPPVSRGTWTLLYVLMRIGLAQHLSSIGEPVPLILDDPFVEVDSQRLPRMLDFLLELSGRMQVLFFSKDDSILRWFEAHASLHHHRLHRLSNRLIVAAGL